MISSLPFQPSLIKETSNMVGNSLASETAELGILMFWEQGISISTMADKHILYRGYTVTYFVTATEVLSDLIPELLSRFH